VRTRPHGFAGYGAVWHGQKSWNGVAILARGAGPVETRRGLPGDSDDTHSRYIEAAIGGLLVGCLYLPNGNPRSTRPVAKAVLPNRMGRIVYRLSRRILTVNRRAGIPFRWERHTPVSA
jgi:exonuclease III